ncbi:MAG: class II D-tagatose-bisphosphate aldolase, non-catalytic subunit [Candidatus Glassbacteria bacterium]|nr:class II D-tagatose-bisphosphate aldolase, non-catalytic subunit [Candidatus Glassbacteria bacterium]
MGRLTADHSRIRQLAEQAGEPLTDCILKALKKGFVEREEDPVTLFAACPNSEAVARASIRAARKHNAPIKYAATLNQVDLDGGYTRWTQQEFMDLVRDEVDSSGFEGPVIVALDHGGPWLKDKQTIENWPLEQAMQGVKDSLAACIDAGYDLLHIDPTVDRTLDKGQAIAIKTVVERTVELIEHAERHRRGKGLPRISYEVGTEEVHGGLADISTFRKFLNGLREGLKVQGLEDVWPCFVVGKVGTDLHTTLFDPVVAETLVKNAAEYGSFIKGHYTDGVENPEAYPESEMGGANVGPEFTEAEYFSLKKLAMSESEFVGQGKLGSESGLMEALENAVVASGRWEKWRQAAERGKDFSELAPERREWLVRTGCRYIWTDPGVLEARRQLYANLSGMGIDAENEVIDGIIRAMDKYFEKFNLSGTIPRIEKELEEGL